MCGLVQSASADSAMLSGYLSQSDIPQPSQYLPYHAGFSQHQAPPDDRYQLIFLLVGI